MALLATRLNERALDWQVVNASISGETTSGGLARLPAALDTHNPEVVVIELGGNDGLRGYPIAQVKANLYSLVRIAKAEERRVLLVGMQIPPNYGPRYTGAFARMYTEVAHQEQVELVPFLLDGVALNPQLMQDDGIHPVAEAQLTLLDNIWPTLLTLLEG